MPDETVTTETVTTTEPASEAPEVATPAEAQNAAATAEAAAEVATEAATQAASDAALTSSLVSAASATADELASLTSQNKLLRENLELVFRRVDQTANLLTATLAPFQGALQDMETTADLMQQVISRQDEQQEQLAVALVSLAKVTVELSAAVSELTRPKAK